jgi:hypothetical protein
MNRSHGRKFTRNSGRGSFDNRGRKLSRSKRSQRLSRGRERNRRDQRRSGTRQRGARTSSTLVSKERIQLESGRLLLIDQFMPANELFREGVEKAGDNLENLEEIVRKFGGEVVKLEPGTYKIARDPFKFFMAIYPETGEFREQELDKSMKAIGTVNVNTRCLALVDLELLNDTEFLKQYSNLWYQGKDKKCRDLLREAGGAVRYGFNRHGDELGVHVFREANRVYLWPTVESSEFVADEEVEEAAL